MMKAAQLLEGIDLAWWPTILHSVSDHGRQDSAPAAGQPDSFTTALEDFASLLRCDESDALEELTLP
jgi:hypothetical protein